MTNGTATKRCPHCDAIINWRRVTCLSRTCIAASSAAWLAERRRLRTAHPTPTLRSVTSSQRREVLSRDGWRCHICGYDIDHTETWPSVWAVAIDHVVPLSKGGSNALDNLAPAHSYCNGVKGDRLMADMDISPDGQGIS